MGFFAGPRGCGRVALIDRCSAGSNGRDDLGLTALLFASDRGHVDVAQLLLEAGAEKDLQDTRGRTVLELAAKRYAPFSLALKGI